MAVHNSLLVGPNARGSIGNIYTFANVKGKGVMKAKSSPTNRNSADQQTQRGNFSAIVTQWHEAAVVAADKIAWRDRATKVARGLSGWNLFMSIYRKAFAAGDTLVYLTGVSVTVGAPNLTVAGDISSDDDYKISVFNDQGVFQLSATDTAAAGAFSTALTLADCPTSGWVLVEVTTAVHTGSCGYYHYSV